MIVWGIDPAATTGYGVLVDGALKWCGEWKLQVPNEPEQRRYVRLWHGLNALLERGKPDHVAYERGGGQSFNTVRAHGGYHAVIEVWSHEHGIVPRWFGPTMVKKRAIGNGRADKNASMDAYEERWGHWPKGDNASDAAHVAWCMWEEVRDAG